MSMPKVVAEAIKEVTPARRIAALKVARKAYVEALKKLVQFDDFSESENRELAAEAAAAEVAYKFQ